MKRTSAILALAVMCTAALLKAQAPPAAQERPIPKLVQKDGRYALMVDGAPFLMLYWSPGRTRTW